MSKHLPNVALFFQKYYNSLTCIDGLKSYWFIEDLALEAIKGVIGARLRFARDYFYKMTKNGEDRPCVMEGLNYDRIYPKQSISQYGYKCPVSWKLKKKYVHCCQRPEFAVLYQNQFFYFASVVERDIFCKDP
jgi:hypothetical protein